MQPMFDYILKFQFKNLFALIAFLALIWMMEKDPTMHDSGLILLTLLFKYYYDTSNASSKKDEVIGKALTAAQNTPAATITIDQQ